MAKAGNRVKMYELNTNALIRLVHNSGMDSKEFSVNIGRNPQYIKEAIIRKRISAPTLRTISALYHVPIEDLVLSMDPVNTSDDLDAVDSVDEQIEDIGQPEIPTVQMVKDYAESIGAEKRHVSSFYSHYQKNGWKTQDEAPIYDWRRVFQKWVERSLSFDKERYGKFGKERTPNSYNNHQRDVYHKKLSNEAAQKIENEELEALKTNFDRLEKSYENVRAERDQLQHENEMQKELIRQLNQRINAVDNQSQRFVDAIAKIGQIIGNNAKECAAVMEELKQEE